MEFLSKWITTEDFADKDIVNIFFKENEAPKISGEIRNYHTHFRKKVTFETTKNVFVNITADDYYKLYINGEFVCQGPSPAYPWNYNFNRVDISPFIRKGENIIAVHVYYQGHITRTWPSADNRQGMIADFYCNEKFIFGTDESWRYSVSKEFSGDLVGYQTSYLENIDFNLEEKGWQSIEFDDSHYKAAICKNVDYSFADEPASLIEVYKKLPKRIEKIDAGKYFVDFGEEITGQFYMSMTGNKGQKVRILCGEETIEGVPNLVRHNMRCNCNYDETCILSGMRDDFNFFEYKAFRYVNVFTDCDNIEPDTFCAIVRHHKFKEKYALKTDVPYLSDIWNICKNAVKYASQGSLVDCPSREKGVYLGDFTVSGLAHLYLTGDTEYYKKILFDFAASSRICKGIMACANSGHMQEIADFSLQYPLQILNYYRYSGDLETVRQLYPTVKGILEHFRKFARQDGLLYDVHDKWNLVDWPENLRDDYNAVIDKKAEVYDCHNVLNAFYIGALKTANELCSIMGICESYDTKSIEKAFIKSFYNEKTGLFCDNETLSHSALHSNVLPLFYDFAPEYMHSKLKNFIMEKGLCCGVQFSYFVLKALAKIDAYEEEFKLLTNETEHSWINMIKEGATTCFEAWGKDQKWNTSLCHPWASAPIIVIFEDLKDKFDISLLSL